MWALRRTQGSTHCFGCISRSSRAWQPGASQQRDKQCKVYPNRSMLWKSFSFCSWRGNNSFKAPLQLNRHRPIEPHRPRAVPARPGAAPLSPQHGAPARQEPPARSAVLTRPAGPRREGAPGAAGHGAESSSSSAGLRRAGPHRPQPPRLRTAGHGPQRCVPECRVTGVSAPVPLRGSQLRSRGSAAGRGAAEAVRTPDGVLPWGDWLRRGPHVAPRCCTPGLIVALSFRHGRTAGRRSPPGSPELHGAALCSSPAGCAFALGVYRNNRVCEERMEKGRDLWGNEWPCGPVSPEPGQTPAGRSERGSPSHPVRLPAQRPNALRRTAPRFPWRRPAPPPRSCPSHLHLSVHAIGCGRAPVVAGGGPSPSFPCELLAVWPPQRAGIGRGPGRWGAGAGAVLLLFRCAAPRLCDRRRSLSARRRHAGEQRRAGARARGEGWERDGAGDAAGRFPHSWVFTDRSRGPWGSLGRRGPGPGPEDDGAVLGAASLRHLSRSRGGGGGLWDPSPTQLGAAGRCVCHSLCWGPWGIWWWGARGAVCSLLTSEVWV